MVKRQQINDTKKNTKINVGDKKLMFLDPFFDKEGNCKDVSNFNTQYL